MTEAIDPRPEPSKEHPQKRQRIDKWLWHARIIKTRTQAATLASGHSIRVNGEKISKASHAVKAGDTITLYWAERIRVLEIVGFADARVSAPVAATLYEDHSPPPIRKEQKLAETGLVREPGTGRPTKRDRRLIDRLQQPDQ